MKEQDLCKSHIIPKSFYPKSNNIKCITVYGDKPYTKRVQSGLYEYLLCEKAEKIFGIYEQHAKKILISNIDKYSKLMQQIIIIPKDEYNYEYLKKFFISIIWRMSVSKIEHFENINLGKYENIALKILKNEIPMNENFFVVMIRKNPEKSIYNSFFNAIMFKYNKKPACRLSFGGYNCDIILEHDIKYFKSIPLLKTFTLLKDENLNIPILEIIADKTKNEILERLTPHSELFSNF